MRQQERVGIIGVGYEGFRPVVSDLSTRELMFEAASKAYKDASIDPRRDVGSFVCCTEDLWEGWSIADEMVPDQIAAAGRPLCTVPADAVTGLGTATMHLLSGIADVVVLEAHSKVADVLDKDAVEALAQEPSLIRPLGMDSDALAGLEMDAFLRARGLGMREVDRIIIDEKEEAMRNPQGQLLGVLLRVGYSRFEGALEPAEKGRQGGLRGGGNRTGARLRELGAEEQRDPVFLDGVAWCSSLPWYDGGDVSLAGYAWNSFNDAAERAGVKPVVESFDILELDDTYSYKLLQHLHSMAKSRAEEERVLSGDGPALNPSGGALGIGNLLEASALHRLLECVLQLRGEAGGIQVKGARSALVQSWRGVPTATGGVAMLSR